MTTDEYLELAMALAEADATVSVRAKLTQFKASSAPPKLAPGPVIRDD
jgi:hypothetical protein